MIRDKHLGAARYAFAPMRRCSNRTNLLFSFLSHSQPYILISRPASSVPRLAAPSRRHLFGHLNTPTPQPAIAELSEGINHL